MATKYDQSSATRPVSIRSHTSAFQVRFKHTSSALEMSSVNPLIIFKLLSLNARGIRSFDKRKTIVNWLCKSGADLCFLQETYSSKEVENIWRKQWKGDMFFSHGSSHSRGVLILVRDQLDFKLLSSRVKTNR